jgi:thiol-disulfide isomerase/thioredoxin
VPAQPEVVPPPAPVVPAAPVSLVVRGRLVGHDGSPMKLANVHLGDVSVPVEADGGFRFEGKRPGFVSVRFTGVDHEPRTLGLFLDGREQALEVRLGTYPREATLEHAALMLRARTDGALSTRLHGVLFTRNPRGRFVASVPAAKGDVLYQVRDVVPDRMVNGPESDAFEYDGDGDYFSVLHAHKGPRQVYLDPAALPPAGLPLEVRFADPESTGARIARLHLDAASRAAGAAGNTAWRAEILKAIASAQDRDVGAALRIAYFVPPPPKTDEAAALARQLLDTLPADASLWRFWPEAALSAVEIAGTTPLRAAYLDQLLDALPDAEVAARFLSARIRAAARAGRDDELARLYPLLRQRFASSPAVRAMALYDPARRVRPGRDLPDIDLPALPDARTPKDTHVTRAALHGKLVLLDFWGTWCMPCRAEVKVLEQVFAKHQAEGFTIVSVAAFDKPARVQGFRRSVSPMPWTHVVLGENQEDVLTLFGTKSFPTELLVDGAGHVLAAGEELRGERLERAVANALAAPHP